MKHLLLLPLLFSCVPTAPQTGDEAPPTARIADGIGPSSVAPLGPAPVVTAQPVSVRELAPKGAVTSAGQLTVSFDGPVVSLGGADEQDATGLITLEPPVKGKTWWLAPDTLVFEPETPFEAATSYGATLKTPLQTLGGHSIQGPVTWKFETDRPRVTSVHPENRSQWVHLDDPIFLSFSHPVTPTQVTKHVHLRVAGSASEIPLRAFRPTAKQAHAHDIYWDLDDTVGVRPRRKLEPGTKLEVVVDPGWTAGLGPLPATATFRSTFETYGRLEIAETNCGADKLCTLGAAVTFRTTNTLADGGDKHVKVSPKPDDLYLQIWGDEITLEGTFRNDVDYSVTISGQLRDEYGQKLGKTHRASLRFAPPPPTLALSVSAGLMDATRPARIGMTGRFVNSVNVERVRLDRDQVREAWLAGKDPLAAQSYASLTGRMTQVQLAPKGPSQWAAEEILLGGGKPTAGLELVRIMTVETVDGRAAPTGDAGLFGVTNLGLSTVLSAGQSFARVVHLATGTPVSGVTVNLWSGHNDRKLGVTGPDGLVPLTVPTDAKSGAMLWAQSKDDAVPLVLSAAGYGSPFSPLALTTQLTGELISERGVYKPGERVHVVGFANGDVAGSKVGVEHLPEGTKVHLVLTDRDGQQVHTEERRLSARGKFTATFQLPNDAALGRWSVSASVGQTKLGTLSARFKVENYRVPEFSVAATTNAAEYVQDDDIKISIVASYYSGGGAPIRRIRSQSGCRPVGPLVRGLDGGWVAGAWPPYSRGTMGLGTLTEDPGPDGHDGKLEKRFNAHVREKGYAARCAFRAAIQDATFQEEGSEAVWAVHPAAAYAALKVPANPKFGDDGVVEFKGIDRDGSAAPAGVIHVTVKRTWWAPKYGRKGKRTFISGYTRQEVVHKRCQADDKGDRTHRCALGTLKEGTYEVTAIATAGTHTARSDASFWVPSGRWEPISWEPPRRLELHVAPGDRRPGDTVDVVVRAPWKGAHGVLLLNRGGVRDRIPFQLAGEQAEFQLEVDDTWVPKVEVQAMLWQPGEQTRKALLHREDAWISVPNSHRQLSVAVRTAATAGPRDTVPITVEVADLSGSPVTGRATIWAVDEAVLSLTDYEVVDLLEQLTSKRNAEVGYADMYRRLLDPWIKPSDDPLLTGGVGMSGFGRGGGGMGYGGTGAAASIALPVARSKFETTPLFLADVAIVDGAARTKVELPDNLTTFRVMALVTSNLADHDAPGRTGHGQAMLRVEKAVVMRAAMPRQLRPGDTATIAAVVTVASGKPGSAVEIVASVAGVNGDAPFALAQQRATAVLGDDGQVRVPFGLSTRGVGHGTITLTALVGELSDAIELPLEVRAEPTAIEHVASYGSLADGEPIALPVTPPKRTVGPVSVNIEASGTLLGGLRDASRALVDYPYGCLEQTSSRMMPLVALSELGEMGFPVDGIADVNQFMKDGIARILSMQTPSGGFSYWPGGKEPNAYASGYAVWVLTMARRAGHTVPDRPYEKSLAWLLAQTNAPDEDWPDYRIYMHDVRRALTVHALAQAGRPAGAAMDQLYERRQSLPRFAQAFLLMAIHTADRGDARVEGMFSDLAAAVGQNQSTAHIVETARWDLREVFHSDTRTDAIALMAMLEVRPDHPAVVKMARGLLDARSQGTWRNTQENAYAVLGLSRYAAVYEREVPDMTVKAWVADDALINARLVGRSADPVAGQLDIESNGEGPVSIVLARAGKGRAYYRLGMSYARPTKDLTAIERGIGLTSSLRSQSGPIAPGATVPVGTLMAMDITLTARSRVRHVAVNLPIPAGLEPINLSLGGPKVLPLGGRRGWFVSHEELHPDRALVFADDLSPGTHHHTVYLRATTPGTYDMPAARAEAMYAPEIFSRAPGRTLVVQ